MAEFDPKKSNVHSVVFWKRAVGSGASGNAMSYGPYMGDTRAAADHFRAPFNGSIVAMTANSRSVVNTGSITFRPLIAGTTSVATMTLSGTSSTYTSFRRLLYTFDAGDRIAVNYTSGATFTAGASNAVFCNLYVHFEQ